MGLMSSTHPGTDLQRVGSADSVNSSKAASATRGSLVRAMVVAWWCMGSFKNVVVCLPWRRFGVGGHVLGVGQDSNRRKLTKTGEMQKMDLLTD